MCNRRVIGLPLCRRPSSFLLPCFPRLWLERGGVLQHPIDRFHEMLTFLNLWFARNDADEGKLKIASRDDGAVQG